MIGGTAGESDGSGAYTWQRATADEDFPAAAAHARNRSAGAIEPPTHFGEWRFTETTAGTEVLYRSCADIGGRVLGWTSSGSSPAVGMCREVRSGHAVDGARAGAPRGAGCEA